MEENKSAPKETPKKEEKKSGSVFFMVLSGVLFAVSGVLGYLLYTTKTTVVTQTQLIEKKTSEYDSVRDSLADLLTKYETMETDNKQLQSQLDQEREKITDLLEQLEKAKGDAGMLDKVRRELGTIRKLTKSYLHQIDSLNVANTRLTEENTKVKGELEVEKTTAQQLNEDKKMLSEKVELGAKLKTYTIFADGVNEKGKKDASTAKARKVDKIRCVFMLSENSIAKPGKRTMYMVITGPDGKIYSVGQDSENSITVNGSKLPYSSKKEINYNNKAQEVTMYFNKKDEFLKGKYMVDLYCDEAQAGATTFELK